MNLSSIDDHILKVIERASDTDSYELSLKLKNYSPEVRKFIAEQVKSRRKAKKKIPVFYQTRGIVYPPGESVEQASSSVTASYKAEMIKGGEVIDLTGGMGIDSYYFSQKAEKVFYVEKNSELAEIAKYNFNKLKAENIAVFNKDSSAFIEEYSGKAKLIYLDPSRRKGSRRVFRLEDSEPDINKLLPGLFRKSDAIMIKLSPFLDLSYLINKFDSLFEIHIVASDQECKELLVCLSPGNRNSQCKVITFETHGNSEQLFSFPFSESEHYCEYADPGKYLFDVNVAIRKSIVFHPVCKEFGVRKISVNSHLFTGDQIPDSFPGKVFEIEGVFGVREFYRKKPVKTGVIVTRNFPEAVELIRKKSGISEGDDHYVYGTRNKEQKALFLVCRRLN